MASSVERLNDASNPFHQLEVVAKAELLVDSRCELGECPVWSEREQAIYWIDCANRRLYRHFLEDGCTEDFGLSGLPASFAFREQGGILMAFRNRLALLDLDAGTEIEVPSPCVDFSIERFNDGKCDPAGRFFVGTMHKDRREPLGGLFRVNADLTVTKVAKGFTLSNGLEWSPDRRTMYHCDSRPGLIYAYDYDLETGTPTRRRILADTSATGFHPDGCISDREGCLWVAMPGTGRLVRFSPEGNPLTAVEVPTPRLTSAAFGGPNLDRLFVPSMRYSLSVDVLESNPTAGGMFATGPIGHGSRQTLFAG
jgi:L-arabinonolactonase